MINSEILLQTILNNYFKVYIKCYALKITFAFV